MSTTSIYKRPLQPLAPADRRSSIIPIALALFGGVFIGGGLLLGVQSIKSRPTAASERSVTWANATLTDEVLRTAQFGLGDDHVVVWRTAPTPTPAPEATPQP
jgi:hypothetical protein